MIVESRIRGTGRKRRSFSPGSADRDVFDDRTGDKSANLKPEDDHLYTCARIFRRKMIAKSISHAKGVNDDGFAARGVMLEIDANFKGS